ncbi:helix-loop-helix protein delilah-like [Lingula anatina]|uniref:Helix-loop-helix protein delilah-like n=1 Tax=Lingula anatina TaxID=7574 RepID=A0A1S3KCQ6_LINAN|nr:helix-loop-helix protein delilah-like [Lingula anatina]|eukprot:XP_013420413.1 helix-loop-helix protein delilah-like [Lingula anatina]
MEISAVCEFSFNSNEEKTTDRIRNDSESQTSDGSERSGSEKRKGSSKDDSGAQSIEEGQRPKRKRRECKTTSEYNFRYSSIINRINTERKRNTRKEPKPKSKPPPLSKYRRRTANARERDRMKEMNDAFETLRTVIPSYPVGDDGLKVTKITTLRLALNYIKALRDTLGYASSDSLSDQCLSPGSSEGGAVSPLPNHIPPPDVEMRSPPGSGLDSEGEAMVIS